MYNGVYILVYTERSGAVRSAWGSEICMGQLVHLTANADDLAMTTILSQTKDEVYQVFTELSMLARQTFGITLHIQSPTFSLFSCSVTAVC